MVRSRNMCWLLLGLLVMVTWGSKGGVVYAEDIPEAGGGYQLSGDHLVWYADDADGNRQIYYKKLSTGESRRLTNTQGPKASPMVSGNLVVWQEKRGTLSQWHWDIYGYDLETGEERKLNAVEGPFIQPTTDGKYVTWEQNDAEAALSVYNWELGQTSIIGQGRSPIIGKGKILYNRYLAEDLDLYDIETKENKTVFTPTGTEYVSWFEFNGDTAIFIQNTLELKTKYVLLTLSEDAPQSKDLTGYTKKDRNFAEMAVGDHYVAWMEDKNGVAQILAADIETATVKQITSASVDQRPLAIVGDVLVSTGEKPELKYEVIQHSDSTIGKAPSKGSPTKPQPQPQQEPEPDLLTIGTEGGELKSADGAARLYFTPGALQPETKLTLKIIDVSEVGYESGTGSRFRQLSDLWSIESDKPFTNPGQLDLSFDSAGLLPDQYKKAAIYRWDPTARVWGYIGGLVDANGKLVSASVETSGIYGVLLYEMTFSDVDKHWARLPIEILASRWMINGMGDGGFHPDEKLTRAQFAKLLAAASGLEPVSDAVQRFPDVNKNHWGYGWIEAAARAGLIKGSDTGFRPDAEITRQEMMVMLVRAIGEEKTALSMDTREVLQEFADAGDLGDWARGYAASAIRLGLIQGDGDRLAPQALTTRAEAAAVTLRLLTKLGKL